MASLQIAHRPGSFDVACSHSSTRCLPEQPLFADNTGRCLQPSVPAAQPSANTAQKLGVTVGAPPRAARTVVEAVLVLAVVVVVVLVVVVVAVASVVVVVLAGSASERDRNCCCGTGRVQT